MTTITKSFLVEEAPRDSSDIFPVRGRSGPKPRDELGLDTLGDTRELSEVGLDTRELGLGLGTRDLGERRDRGRSSCGSNASRRTTPPSSLCRAAGSGSCI